MSTATAADFEGLPPSRAGSLTLLGGALCLNFCNTTSGRGTSQVQEHLRSFDNLLAWVTHAGAIDLTAARHFEKAPPSPSEGERALHRTLALRAALHSIFSSVMAGVPAPAPALVTLNDVLAQSMAAARIQQSTHGFSWTWENAPWSADRLLWPVARSAAELLITGDLSRLRVCPGCFCGWMFLDKTRNGRRRWCEMEVCGSRDKMRRYHQRQRDGHHREIRADTPF
jgi:predicted RNA-binding Zn ribbon-like protein